MAETKKLSELQEATEFSASDTLLMQKSSNGQAMKVSGTKLLNMINGHGGISSIAKSSTSGKTDTYKITFTDGSSSTFTVSNGADGKDGENGTKISGVNVSVVNNGGETSGTATLGNETSSGKPINITLYNINGRDGSDLGDVTADIEYDTSNTAGVTTIASGNSTTGKKDLKFLFKNVVGKDGDNLAEVTTQVATDTSDTSTRVVPTYTSVDGNDNSKKLDLKFVNIKGDKGATGTSLKVNSTTIEYGNSDSATTEPATWTATADPQAGGYLWIKMTIVYKSSAGSSVIKFPVRNGTNGADGSGSVSKVCNVSPVGGNITLTATNVGAIATSDKNTTGITSSNYVSMQSSENLARIKDIHAYIEAYLNAKAETWTFTNSSGTETTRKVIVIS